MLTLQLHATALDVDSLLSNATLALEKIREGFLSGAETGEQFSYEYAVREKPGEQADIGSEIGVISGA
jgi:hypothetical protein